MLFVVYNIRDSSTQNGNYYDHTLCLPEVGNGLEKSLHLYRTNGVMCTSVKVLC